MEEVDTDPDYLEASKVLDQRLFDLTKIDNWRGPADRHKQVADVREAIDALIHVRMAQFAELMAERSEALLGARL